MQPFLTTPNGEAISISLRFLPWIVCTYVSSLSWLNFLGEDLCLILSQQHPALYGACNWGSKHICGRNCVSDASRQVCPYRGLNSSPSSGLLCRTLSTCYFFISGSVTSSVKWGGWTIWSPEQTSSFKNAMLLGQLTCTESKTGVAGNKEVSKT